MSGATALNSTAQQLIDDLRLQPHPEGGYFAETYRSELCTEARGGARAALTSIYYLLAGDAFSAFHRIASDEIWHAYAGDVVTIETINPEGRHVGHVIGDGQQWQAVVPAGCWFAAHTQGPMGFALVGCDVAPGFDFADFELASREALTAAFPQHAPLIARWTQDD